MSSQNVVNMEKRKRKNFTFSVNNLIYLEFTFPPHICLTITTNKFQLQIETQTNQSTHKSTGFAYSNFIQGQGSEQTVFEFLKLHRGHRMRGKFAAAHTDEGHSMAAQPVLTNLRCIFYFGGLSVRHYSLPKRSNGHYKKVWPQLARTSSVRA